VRPLPPQMPQRRVRPLHPSARYTPRPLLPCRPGPFTALSSLAKTGAEVAMTVSGCVALVTTASAIDHSLRNGYCLTSGQLARMVASAVASAVAGTVTGEPPRLSPPPATPAPTLEAPSPAPAAACSHTPSTRHDAQAGCMGPCWPPATCWAASSAPSWRPARSSRRHAGASPPSATGAGGCHWPPRAAGLRLRTHAPHHRRLGQATHAALRRLGESRVEAAAAAAAATPLPAEAEAAAAQSPPPVHPPLHTRPLTHPPHAARPQDAKRGGHPAHPPERQPPAAAGGRGAAARRRRLRPLCAPLCAPRRHGRPGGDAGALGGGRS
jgi:hypothetical protein